MDASLPDLAQLRARCAAGWALIVVVRHGRTPSNAQRRFCGRLDPPLDQVGNAQATALGRWVRESLGVPVGPVFASPAARARATARAVASPTILDDLAELDQGELEGLTYPEAFERFAEFFARWQSDPASVRVPGGETLEEVRVRAERAFTRISETCARSKLTVVVTHQFVQAAYLSARFGDGVSQWKSWELDNGALRVLGRDRGGVLHPLAGPWRP